MPDAQTITTGLQTTGGNRCQDKWWSRLSRDGRRLPANVPERVCWYEAAVTRQRYAFYAVEGLVIAASASIPATVAAGVPAIVAGGLGATVTALVSTRQLLRSRENWIRCSATRAALEHELVAWSIGGGKYAESATADALLAMRVEQIVAHETAQWTILLSDNSHHRGNDDTPTTGSGTE